MMVTLSSPVWGDVPRTMTATHNQRPTWDADYGYGRDHGMDGIGHPGIDVSMTAGTPLRAIRGGRVVTIRAENYPTGTKEVVIEDATGERQLYTHTSRQSVTAGDTVTAGQVIAHSGDPGPGAHLHFEHRVRDASTKSGWRIVDPVPLLTGTTSQPSGPYRPTSPLLGETLGTPDRWIAWAETAGVRRLPDFATYAREVYRLCRIAGPSGPQAHKLLAQWHLETAGGTSRWWVERLNPAGLGITGDSKQNEASKVFLDGVDAARAQFHHAYQYARWPLPAWVEVYRANNPRADAVPVAVRGTKETLADFGSTSVTTWAYDPEYGAKWASRLNQLRDVFAGAVTPQPEPEPQPEPGQGGPDMATHRFILSAGHRNEDRGGARNEINWTYPSVQALKRRIEARGGRAWIVQEQDGDNDPSFCRGRGLQNAARRCVELASQFGPFDAYISSHYDSTPGFHAIFPDGANDTKAMNPKDVRLCRAMRDRVRATNTVRLKAWPADGPGVMSERETHVGSQGHRLGEFVGTLGFRDRTVRVIVEASGVGEERYLNDPHWVEHVYCEALVDALEDVFGAFRATQPQPEPEPQPEPQPTYEERSPITEVVGLPAYVKLGNGSQMVYVGYTGKAKRDTPRLKWATADSPKVGPDVKAGETFAIDYLILNPDGSLYYYTPYATRLRFEDVEPLFADVDEAA